MGSGNARSGRWITGAGPDTTDSPGLAGKEIVEGLKIKKQTKINILSNLCDHCMYITNTTYTCT